MDNFELTLLTVGSRDCPIQSIVSIIGENEHNISENWLTLATGLGIPNLRIANLKQDLKLKKITKCDLISSVVVEWVGRNGSRATLSTLLQVLETITETEQTDDGTCNVEESIRLCLNLPCNAASNNPQISWNELSPAFQNKVRGNFNRFYPSLIFDDVLHILKGDILIHLMTGKDLQNFKQTIPETLSYFIDRKILTRKIISLSIFEQHSPDILLLDGMDRYELIDRVPKHHKVRSSSEQMKGVTVKFMILDHPTHFEKICSRTPLAVHLLHWKTDRLTWMRSRGKVESLQKYVDTVQLEQNEEDFLADLESKTELPICIADTPGMGKSVLLANFGKTLTKLFPERNVIFLLLPEFIALYKQYAKNHPKNAILAIEKTLLTMSCENELGRALLKSKIIADEGLLVELLLDGFDEVHHTNIQLAHEILQKIKTSFKSVRLWVTSRPHFMTQLENNLCTLGYTIKPFSFEEQLKFLTSYWTRDDSCGQGKLLEFAEQCLGILNSNLKSKDHDIAGVPLQCLLIGEIYEEEAITYASNDQSTFPSVVINDTTDLYKLLIVRKIKKYLDVHERTDFRGMDDDIMGMHARLSLELIFPEQVDKFQDYFNQDHVTLEEVFKVGIVEASASTLVPRFIHRTIAEYLIAWFVVNRLTIGTGWDEELTSFLLEKVLQVQIVRQLYKFDHPVIFYFMNSVIDNLSLETIPKEVRQGILNTSVTAQDKMLTIAKACGRSNFFTIFTFFDAINAFKKHSKNIFNLEFLLLVVQRSSLGFVKAALVNFEKNYEFDLEVQIRVLLLAVGTGKFSTVEFLIKEKGIRWMLEDPYGDAKRLLHVCVDYSKDNAAEIEQRIQLMRMLLAIDYGLLEKRGYRGETPLLYGNLHMRIVKELFSFGSNVLARNDDNHTILHLNLKRSAEDFQSLLIEIPEASLRKLVQVKDKHEETPLISILNRFDPLPITFTRLEYLEADFNCCDWKGYSVLARAIERGRNLDTLRHLIYNGADVGWRRSDNGSSLLHVAALHEKAETVGFLVDELGMNVNLENFEGETPMDVILKSDRDRKHEKRLEIGLYLHGRGGTYKEHPSSEGSRLHLAAEEGNLISVRLLILLHVDVNGTDKEGNSPLHSTMKYKRFFKDYYSVTKLLLDNNANPNAVNNLGETPFNTALKTKDINFDVIQLLKSQTKFKWTQHIAHLVLGTLTQDTWAQYAEEWDYQVEFEAVIKEVSDCEVEFDVNYQDFDGNSLLLIAAKCKNLDAVRFLVGKKGADVKLKNKRQQTALHIHTLTPRRNFFSIIKTLADNGADMFAKDDQGFTFLHYFMNGCSSPHQLHAMAEYLMEKNSLVLFETPGGLDGATPFALLLQIFKWDPFPKTLSLLRNSGINLNKVDSLGNPVLLYAILGRRSAKVLDEISCRELDWKFLDDDNNSLLHISALYGNLKSLNFLLELGKLNVNGVNDKGNTPLHCAIQHDDKKTKLDRCDLLIIYGADIKSVNSDGETPFSIAARDDDVGDEVLKLLGDQIVSLSVDDELVA